MSRSRYDAVNPRDRIQQLGAEILADVDSTLDTILPHNNSDDLPQLEADIHYLEHHIMVQLRRRRNSRMRFLRLPPEIMSRTALALAETYPPRMPIDNAADLGWIKLSQVCDALRTLVSSNKQLWANDAFTIPDLRYCHIMLHRAGDLPLTVKLVESKRDNDSPDLKLLLKKHLARVRTISVTEHTNRHSLLAFRQALWPFSCQEMSGLDLPILHSLSIKNDRSGFDPIDHDAYSPMVTPNLHYLALANAYVPFDSSTLTELSLATGLSAHNPVRDHIPPPELFLNIIRNGRNLRVLKLYVAIPDLEYVNSSRSSICLPQLEMLSMHDNSDRCLKLLSFLDISAHTIVRLHLVHVGEESSEHAIDQLSFLRPFVASAYGAHIYHGYILKLYLFLPSSDCVRYDPSKYPSTRTSELSAEFEHDMCILELEVHGIDARISSAAANLPKFAAVLGLESVCKLHIENEQDYDTQEWCSMLEFFKNVRTLEVDTVHYGRRFARSMDHGGVVQALQNNPNIIIPRLQVLRLQTVRICAELSTDALLLLARTRTLQSMRIGLLVLDDDNGVRDALWWEDEREAFMMQMQSLGTSAEGFTVEQEELIQENNEARERVRMWQEQLRVSV